jgi:hypothetical protein
MAEAENRADEMFKVAMKSAKEGKSVQVLPPGHHAPAGSIYMRGSWYSTN